MRNLPELTYMEFVSTLHDYFVLIVPTIFDSLFCTSWLYESAHCFYPVYSLLFIKEVMHSLSNHSDSISAKIFTLDLFTKYNNLLKLCPNSNIFNIS